MRFSLVAVFTVILSGLATASTVDLVKRVPVIPQALLSQMVAAGASLSAQMFANPGHGAAGSFTSWSEVEISGWSYSAVHNPQSVHNILTRIGSVFLRGTFSPQGRRPDAVDPNVWKQFRLVQSHPYTSQGGQRHEPTRAVFEGLLWTADPAGGVIITRWISPEAALRAQAGSSPYNAADPADLPPVSTWSQLFSALWGKTIQGNNFDPNQPTPYDFRRHPLLPPRHIVWLDLSGTVLTSQVTVPHALNALINRNTPPNSPHPRQIRPYPDRTNILETEGHPSIDNAILAIPQIANTIRFVHDHFNLWSFEYIILVVGLYKDEQNNEFIHLVTDKIPYHTPPTESEDDQGGPAH